MCQLLGDNVILWGGLALERKPNQIHYWHTDIESSAPEGGFVSVWIGIEGAQRESALKLVPGSHLFGKSIQQVIKENGTDRKSATEVQIEQWAKELDQSSTGIVQPDIHNGDAIFFDGRVWHGSENLVTNTVRKALLFQFARADCAIRIPHFRKLEWPFAFREKPLPPCIQIRGRSPRGLNKICDRPPEIKSDLLPLDSKVYDIDLSQQVKKEKRFTQFPLFAGSTKNIQKLTCHYSALKAGHSPHIPHTHVDEEILIVLRGNATLCYDDNEGTLIERTAEPGSAIYYPSFHRHTIKNEGQDSILYLMFKWIGPSREADEKLGLQTFRVDAIGSATQEKRFVSNRCFQGPTDQLKGIEVHISTLLPNGGYRMHTDTHDVAILVMEGTVLTNGQTVSRGQLVLHPAGVDHDMRNTSEEPARYLVVEFHGANCPGNDLELSIEKPTPQIVANDPLPQKEHTLQATTRPKWFQKIKGLFGIK